MNGEPGEMDAAATAPPAAQAAAAAPKASDKQKDLDQNYNEIKSYSWDPFNKVELSPPDHRCLNRIKKDIVEMYSNPAPGILVSGDQHDVTLVHALITGPFSTPYEGGFFYFAIRFPHTYPFDPPKVRLMTTGNGSVRFNPNLYSNGKVCLSILGTWIGPKWLPSQTLSSVLLSIQSLLNEKPYHNEPGYETEKRPDAVKKYNEFIRYQTLRVAVCGALEQMHLIPQCFHDAVISSFLEFYDFYEEICKSNLDKDDQDLIDPLFTTKHGVVKYQSVLDRLKLIKNKYEGHQVKSDDKMEDDDD